MRISIWVGGLVAFLAASSATCLFVPPPSSVPAGAERSGRGVRTYATTLEQLREKVRRGFSAVEESLRAERRGLETALGDIQDTELAGLEEVLRLRDTSPHAPRLLRESLLRLVVGQPGGPEFLALVTGKGDVVIGSPSLHAGVPCEDALLRKACRSLFDGERVGSKRAEVKSSFFATTSLETSRPALFVGAARPFSAEAGPPRAVLIGGLMLDNVAGRSREKLAQLDSVLRLHFFSFVSERHDAPTIVAGAQVDAQVRTALVAEVFAGQISEKPAFTASVGPQVGRWCGVRSYDGKWIGGWGVTVEPSAVAAALSPGVAPPTAPRFLTALGTFDALIVAGMGFLGLGVLWVFLTLWSRFAGQAPPRRGSERATCGADLDEAVPLPRAAPGREVTRELLRVRRRVVELEGVLEQIQRRGTKETHATGADDQEKTPESEEVLA